MMYPLTTQAFAEKEFGLRNLTHYICAGDDPNNLMYISSTLIVQQLPPGRIHQPGSMGLRHLGEQANDKVRATLHRPQNVCLFRLLLFGYPVFISKRLGGCRLQNRFRFLEQTGEPLHAADDQRWRRSFHLVYGEAQARLSFLKI